MTAILAIIGSVLVIAAVVCLIVSWISLLTLSIATYRGAVAEREDALERIEMSAARDAVKVRTLACVAVGLCLSVPLAAFVVAKVAADRLRDLSGDEPDPRFRRAVRCAIAGTVLGIVGLVLLVGAMGANILAAQPTFSYSDPSSPLDGVSSLVTEEGATIDFG